MKKVSALENCYKNFKVTHADQTGAFVQQVVKSSLDAKYGFPQKIQNKDGIDKIGVRFEYKRTGQEDQYIVPYNTNALQM